MQTIFEHFVQLHTLLQVEERRARLELHARATQMYQLMLRVKEKLKSSEKKITVSYLGIA